MGRTSRRWAGVALALGAGAFSLMGARVLVANHALDPTSAGAADGEIAGSLAASTNPPSTTSTSTSTTTSTVPTTTTTTVAPVRTFATGNAQLDALLPTLPAELFTGGATVHYGWNPLDECCHAGGYNPGPNEIWIGPTAFASPARLIYVAAHELAHSVHVKTGRNAALTAAVAGAPVVRAGTWDDSEKVADCVAWVLFPAETAAGGITYWSCPDPWRTQVRNALG